MFTTPATLMLIAGIVLVPVLIGIILIPIAFGMRQTKYGCGYCGNRF